MSETLKRDLREIAKIQRGVGHTEFRIAAMRMFKKLNMASAGVAVSLMEVDTYLTPDEITMRDRMP